MLSGHVCREANLTGIVTARCQTNVCRRACSKQDAQALNHGLRKLLPPSRAFPEMQGKPVCHLKKLTIILKDDMTVKIT